ncbi:MAG: hypothetical protein ABIQ01_01170 [Pseudolysinimonas sp.]
MIRTTVFSILRRRVATTSPRHRRDPRALGTHPWFALREQRTLELGQYR